MKTISKSDLIKRYDHDTREKLVKPELGERPWDSYDPMDPEVIPAFFRQVMQPLGWTNDGCGFDSLIALFKSTVDTMHSIY